MNYVKSILLFHQIFFAYSIALSFSPSIQPMDISVPNNLVIINDISEGFNFPLEEKDLLELDEIGATQGLLLQALYENCSVLCTKLLWNSLEDMAQATDLLIKSGNSWTDFLMKFVTDNTTKEKLYQKTLTSLLSLYEKYKNAPDKHQLNVEVALELTKVKNSDDVRRIKMIFTLYCMHKDFLSKNYVCKEIQQDFILFVPQLSAESKQPAIAEEFYKDFDDWDYRKIDGGYYRGKKSKEMDLESLDLLKLKKYVELHKTLGKSLLEALKNLSLMSNKKRNISIPADKQPVFNIMLVAHGTSDKTANLSIELPKKTELLGQTKKAINAEEKKSEFLKFLYLLNNGFRMGTLLVFSCFTGGKKNIDTYGEDKFNSSFLKDLSYAIINVGARYTPIFGEGILGFGDEGFKKYFSAVNQTPPDYAGMFKSKLLLFDEKFLIYNYMSIRLPHTSWFSPLQYSKEVMSLSQIDASVKLSGESIIVGENKSVLLWGANYVPRTLEIIMKAEAGTIILLCNYYNQNYYVQDCIIKNKEITLEKLNDFFTKKVQEKLNITFKTLQIEDSSYHNVSFFAGQTKKAVGLEGGDSEQLVSGYVYIDHQGAVHSSIFSTTTQEDIKPGYTINKKTYDNYVAQAQQKAQKAVPQSLSQDFINTLSSSVKAKGLKFATQKELEKKAPEIGAKNRKELEKKTSEVETKKRKLVVVDPQQASRVLELCHAIKMNQNTYASRVLELIHAVKKNV